MYAYLKQCDLRGKSVLAVGCGFGDYALRIAKLGTNVTAFNLSPDSLDISKALAKREGLKIAFDEMPAEQMRYQDSSFDYVIARDILHHVDIVPTMREIVRVAKPDAMFVVNEISSHSFTDKLRRSALVEKFIYPRMQRMIYGPGKPYITKDERKLSESDLKEIVKPLQSIKFRKHFNFVSPGLFPTGSASSTRPMPYCWFCFARSADSSPGACCSAPGSKNHAKKRRSPPDRVKAPCNPGKATR